jgi:hypothetical protein
MAFCPAASQVRVPEFQKLGLSQLCKAITLCVDLRSRWGLKQCCSLSRKIFNGMSHATCTQGIQGDSQLLMVGSQFGNLTPGPSFDHNLCFYSNGSCKPILDIYVPRAFQWYKKLLNLMGFDPCNCSLKIQESINTLTPKVGVHLRVWKFNSPTFPYSQPPGSMKCDSRASLFNPHLCKPLPWSRAQG